MAEIARVLRPTGIAVIQVPLSGRLTTDEAVLTTAGERTARYGQADHVRFYGADFFARLSEAGLTSISISLGGTTYVDKTKLPAAAEFDYVRFFAAPEAGK